MRLIFLAPSCALALTFALGISACGGDSRPYDQIPTSTPALVPPAGADDVASGIGATTTTPTTTDTTGSPDSSGVDTGGTSVDTGGTGDTGDTGDTGGGTGGDTGGGGTPADTGGIAPD